MGLNFSHDTSCHDYIDPIASGSVQSLRLAALLQARVGTRDPTMSIEDRVIWRATFTPEGPATVRIELKSDDSITVDGHGPGGTWLVERVPGAVGDGDSVPAIVAQHDSVREAQRIHSGLRIPTTSTPFHELIPTILAQRVTSQEAIRQWHGLVREFGSTAPGPHPNLRLPPDPDRLARLSYVDFHPFGIERKRADTIRTTARLAHFLIKDWDESAPRSAHTASLMNLDGVGVWTAAVVGGISFGDADAIQVGDFHVKNTVAWALHGRPRGTDEEMIASMEPYRGQRHRVVRWLQAAGWQAPSRGPRRRNVSIARM